MLLYRRVLLVKGSRQVDAPSTSGRQNVPVKEEDLQPSTCQKQDSPFIDLTLSEDEDDKGNVVNPGSFIESGLRAFSIHDDPNIPSSSGARGTKRRAEQVVKKENTGASPDSKRARGAHSASDFYATMDDRMKLDFDILQGACEGVEQEEVEWARRRVIKALHSLEGERWLLLMHAIMACKGFDPKVRKEVRTMNYEA